MRHAALCVLILCGLVACSRDPLAPPADILANRTLAARLYAKASDTAVIGSRRYVLKAFLWRDFAPPSPPSGRPLASINWLIALDSGAVPETLSLEEEYVIHGDSVWRAPYEDRPGITFLYRQERRAGGGPRWGPGIHVDVMARVRDAATGQDRYLSRKGVYIYRTD